jgi:hypothetical protein
MSTVEVEEVIDEVVVDEGPIDDVNINIVDLKSGEMGTFSKIGIIILILISYSFIYDLIFTVNKLKKICKFKNASKAISDAVGITQTIITKFVILVLLIIFLTIYFKLNILTGLLIIVSSPLYHALSKKILYNSAFC